MADEKLELTAEFIRTFEPPLDFDFWVHLVEEEAAELEEALEEWAELPSTEADAHVLKEMADVIYVGYGAYLTEPHRDVMSDRVMKRATEAAQKSAELLTVARDVLSSCLVPIDAILTEAVERVHASNMSKCDPVTGEPLRDPETGKILKGPNYQKPHLMDLLDQ